MDEEVRYRLDDLNACLDEQYAGVEMASKLKKRRTL